MADWLEVRLEAESELSEPLYKLLTRYGDCPPTLHTAHAARPTTIAGYLRINDTTAERRRAINAGVTLLSGIAQVGEPRWRELDSAVWATRLTTAIAAGERFLFVPKDYKSPPDGDKITIVLEPGMAFGTGGHVTTVLVLEDLERLDLRGKTVLDLGCGSGVLSLAALALGARRVVAVDNDPAAVQAAQTNRRHNATDAARMEVVEGTLPLPKPQKFDVVLANLTVAVLCRLAPQIAEALKPDAPVLVSGVLEEKRDELTNAFGAHNLFVKRETVRDGWLGLVLDGVRPAEQV